ncbi:MAG TPA: CRISPR-associated protein, partial [Phaeodactylibacter sp.]|nr:CRISPR-associated protein [Phaeodactylibacter sp.]
MSNKKYLYGASVQGIQSFIFQTNKLKEIVGASALVDNLCKDFFDEEFNVDKESFITQTAGNIKCVVDEGKCKDMVSRFPMLAMQYAPGITISQAVVGLPPDEATVKALSKGKVNELEKRLRIQRNRPVMPLDIGYMGLERARRTGGVGVDRKNNEVMDSGIRAKTEKREEDMLELFRKFILDVKASHVPFDLKHITGKNSENSWIAIVHADGNSIGKLVQDIKPVDFKDFSKKLQEATEEAAKEAFEALNLKLSEKMRRYPIRPVILGGDDLTVIIRADLALKFTEAYLKAFEKQTNEILGQKLTACAGIAYIKQNYPFHYGVDLADALTKEAKKASKDISKDTPPSSLSFYKVLSSFVEPLEEMKKRTLSINAKELYFDHGPFFIHAQDKKSTVGDLICKMDKIKNNEDGLLGAGKLRHWLSLLEKD